MNPLIPIIATYGIQFTIDLLDILAKKNDPTADDFRALKEKYASKSADTYLAEAEARKAALTPTP